MGRGFYSGERGEGSGWRSTSRTEVQSGGDTQEQAQAPGPDRALHQSTLDSFTSWDLTIAVAIAEEARQEAKVKAETARREAMEKIGAERKEAFENLEKVKAELEKAQLVCIERGLLNTNQITDAVTSINE